MSSFTLAGNLARVKADVLAVFPGMVVGELGDQAHLAEHSDHNEDSRGVVHAEDLMTLAYQQAHGLTDAQCAGVIVDWLLLPTVRSSLEYVIHDRTIYQVSGGWKPQRYAGTDPHTSHVHVSGLHGATGKDSETGTGYSVTAEKATPAPTLATYIRETTMAAIDDQDPSYLDLCWRVADMHDLLPAAGGGHLPKKPVPLVVLLRTLQADVEALKTSPPAMSESDVQRVAAAVVASLGQAPSPSPSSTS